MKKTFNMPNNVTINFEQIFNAIPTLQVIMDLNFKIVGATDAYIDISLAKKEDIVGMSIL
jgi:hypothetical protein